MRAQVKVGWFEVCLWYLDSRWLGMVMVRPSFNGPGSGSGREAAFPR
jgi:hypothetical protein